MGSATYRVWISGTEMADHFGIDVAQHGIDVKGTEASAVHWSRDPLRPAAIIASAAWRCAGRTRWPKQSYKVSSRSKMTQRISGRLPRRSSSLTLLALS